MTPSPDSSARYEPSGRICEVRFSGMSLLSLISTCADRIIRAIRARPVVVAVHQPDPVRRRTGAGTVPWPHRAGPAPAAALPVRRARAASRTAPGTSSRSAAAPAGTGTGRNHRPCPRCRRSARFAGVSGTRTSVPSSDPAFSGLLLPDGHGTGAAPVRRAPARPSPAPGPAALPGEPGRARSAVQVPGRPRRRLRLLTWLRPRHQRQVPGQRRDHVLDPGVRHQRHQNDHPDHECPGQQPFPLPLHEPGAQRRPPRDPADGTGPGLVLQRPQRRVMHRAALRPDLPVPPTCASATATTLQNTTAPPAPTFSVPDHQRGPLEPSPPRSLPLFSGDASNSSGTATIIPPETGTAHDGTG